MQSLGNACIHDSRKQINGFLGDEVVDRVELNEAREVSMGLVGSLLLSRHLDEVVCRRRGSECCVD